MGWKCCKPYSWFIYRPSSKFYLVDIFKNPTKIKQNSIFIQINMLSYPISLKPTKIKHFSHFTTQKSNSHLTKNSTTIPKSSLFISTFTDNDFSPKNHPKHTIAPSSSHVQHRGYHKTIHKTIKTITTLSYLYAKKIKSNREYIIRNL